MKVSTKQPDDTFEPGDKVKLLKPYIPMSKEVTNTTYSDPKPISLTTYMNCAKVDKNYQ